MRASFQHEINENGIVWVFHNEKENSFVDNLVEILENWGYELSHSDENEMKMFSNTNTEITIPQMRKDYADAKKAAKEITEAGISIKDSYTIV